MNTPPSRTSSNLFIDIWDQFTEPNRSVLKPTDRKQARLSTVLALLLGLFNVSGFIATLKIDLRHALAGFLLPIASVLVGYFLTRTKFYQLGAFIFTLGFSLSVYPTVANDPTSTFGYVSLFYLPLSFILGSALLSQSLLALLVGINFGAIYIAAGLGIISFSEEGIFGVIGVNLAIGIILLFINDFRLRLESERLRELEVVNRELLLAQDSISKQNDVRSADIEMRAKRLESITTIFQQLTDAQDLYTLFDRTTNLIAEQFNCYHVGIFLSDEREKNIILQASSSSIGKKLINDGFRLEISKEIISARAAFQKYIVIEPLVDSVTASEISSDFSETRSEVAIPLLVNNKLIGVIDLHSKKENELSTKDISLYQAIAGQISLALNNIRLTQATQEIMNRFQGMTSEATIEAWKENLGKSNRGYRYTPLGISPIKGTSLTNEVDEKAQIVDFAIELRGKKLGTIKLTRKGSGAIWTDKEKDLIADITNQIGLALENARLLEDLQQRAAREQKINELTSRFSRSLDFDSLLQTAVRELHQLPNVSEVSVFVGNDANKQ